MKTITDFTKRHKASLWGQSRMVTPRLVDWIHGNGKQVIYLTPMDTRPNYYVARIDSSICLDNHSPNDKTRFCNVVLDDLYNAIESQFGESYEEYEHENGRTYIRNNPFPALSSGSGCAWGKLGMIERNANEGSRK